MSIDSTLRDLFVELMASYDSTVDTSSGSAFDTAVMVPLLTRIGGSPLETDLETLAVERIAVEYPDYDTSSVSGIRNMLIRPATVILEPILREIRASKLRESLNNAAQMTRSELTDLLANIFVTPYDGEKATVTAYVYFPSPRSVTFSPLTRFYTSSGLNFYPEQLVGITATQMSFNTESGLFYVTVPLIAENAGAAYKIAIGELAGVEGISGTVKVTNKKEAISGLDAETNEEAVTRGREAITVRNLSTPRGIKTLIREQNPSLSTIQVIGYGDAEMARDVIKGPVTISDIPGGIVGPVAPTLTTGQEVHIGGKTDVYVFQKTPTSDSLDIQNIADAGVRIFAGYSGYTGPGSGTTTTFLDDNGVFYTRNVHNGDTLLFGEYSAGIVTVGVSSLELDTAIPQDLPNGPYEIVRSSIEDTLVVPLYGLIAMDTAGLPVFDTDGDPVAPIPGDTAFLELTSLGIPVKKTENIAQENVLLPLVRVVSVEFLDSLTLEATGTVIPMAECLAAEVYADFTGGGVSTEASGTLRLWFKDACTAWVPNSSAFLYETGNRVFDEDATFNGTLTVVAPGTTIKFTGDTTATILSGFRFVTGGVRYMITTSGTYSAGFTTYTTREAFTVAVSTTVTLEPGVLETDMLYDSTRLLYYFDVDVVAGHPGTSGNLTKGALLTAPGVRAEGWQCRGVQEVLNYSTKELPYLTFSRYVNESTDLKDGGTSYAIRVNYETADQLPAIQTFVESDDNRVEDLLVKHFMPCLVHMRLSQLGLTETEALDKISAYLYALLPTEALEVSDMISELAADHVTLPLELIVIRQGTDRSWTVEFVEDRVTENRLSHFVPDTDRIVINVEES